MYAKFVDDDDVIAANEPNRLPACVLYCLENAVQIVYVYLALEGKARDPTGAVLWTSLGTSFPKPSVPTLPPNPGYATV